MKEVLVNLQKKLENIKKENKENKILLQKIDDIDALWALDQKQDDYPSSWSVNEYLKATRVDIKKHVKNKLLASEESFTSKAYLEYITNLLTIDVTDEGSLALAQVVKDLLKAVEEEKSSTGWNFAKKCWLKEEVSSDIEAEMDAKLALLPLLEDAIKQYQQQEKERQDAVAVHITKEMEKETETIAGAYQKIDELYVQCEEKGHWLEGLNCLVHNVEEAAQKTDIQTTELTKLINSKELLARNKVAWEDEIKQAKETILDRLKHPTETCQNQLNALKKAVQAATTYTAFASLKPTIKQLKNDLESLKSRAKDNPEALAVVRAYTTELSPLVNKKQRDFFVASLKDKVSTYLAGRSITYRVRDIISSVMSFFFGWLGWTTEKSKRQTYVDKTLFTQLNAFDNLGDKDDIEQEKVAVSGVKQAISTGLTLFSPRAQSGPQYKKSLKSLLDTANKDLDEMTQEQTERVIKI